MPDEEQQSAPPTPHLVQPPQQQKPKQRDISKKQHDNHGQRHREHGDDLAGIRAIMFDIEQKIDVLTDQGKVLADMVADLKKTRTDGVEAMNDRLAQVLEAVVQNADDTRQVVRMVALDPRAVPKLRATADKLTGQQTSMAASKDRGFVWSVLFGLAVMVALWLAFRP